jgi:hypothetical protein
MNLFRYRDFKMHHLHGPDRIEILKNTWPGDLNTQLVVWLEAEPIPFVRSGYISSRCVAQDGLPTGTVLKDAEITLQSLDPSAFVDAVIGELMARALLSTRVCLHTVDDVIGTSIIA